MYIHDTYLGTGHQLRGRGGGGFTKQEHGLVHPCKVDSQPGGVKFYPLQKGVGTGKVLALLKGGGGGHNMCWASFNTRAWGFSHTEKGCKTFRPLGGGGGVTKSFTFLRGAQKVLDP